MTTKNLSEKQYTNSTLVRIKEKIEKLSSYEKDEIMKLILEADYPYTQNKNGVFFNITSLDNVYINKIEKFLKFSEINKKRLEEDELVRNKLRGELLPE
jgi:hypothetical protein